MKNWGDKIDTGGLSGYAKDWVDAYNGQIDEGNRPSDTINHGYATWKNQNDGDSSNDSVNVARQSFPDANISVVDWIARAKEEMGAGQLPTFPSLPGLQATASSLNMGTVMSIGVLLVLISFVKSIFGR